jgi:hypothetical protein
MEHKRFTNTDIGIRGVVPDGWLQAQPGVWLRHASEADPTHLVQQRVGGEIPLRPIWRSTACTG